MTRGYRGFCRKRRRRRCRLCEGRFRGGGGKGWVIGFLDQPDGQEAEGVDEGAEGADAGVVAAEGGEKDAGGEDAQGRGEAAGVVGQAGAGGADRYGK